MAEWRIVAGPREYEPAAADCAQGWAWQVARDGETRTVCVEVSRSAAIGRTHAVEMLSVIRDCGCRAVAWAIGEGDPPSRIIVGTTGIHAAAA